MVWEKEDRLLAVGKMLVRLDGKGCKIKELLILRVVYSKGDA